MLCRIERIKSNRPEWNQINLQEMNETRRDVGLTGMRCFIQLSDMVSSCARHLNHCTQPRRGRTKDKIDSRLKARLQKQESLLRRGDDRAACIILSTLFFIQCMGINIGLVMIVDSLA